MAPTMGGCSKYSFRPCSFFDPFVVGSTRLNVKDFDSNLEVYVMKTDVVGLCNVFCAFVHTILSTTSLLN